MYMLILLPFMILIRFALSLTLI